MTDGCRKNESLLIELPDLEDGIPYAFDDGSLAGILKISRRALWATIHTNANATSIHQHHLIPKKGGRVRHVYQPKPFISRVQKKILAYLVNPLQDRLGPHVTAYRKGVNFLDAVREHHLPECPVCAHYSGAVAPPRHSCYRQGTYLHMDLKDFFHSVRRAHVRSAFMSYGYSKPVASYIAGLVTVRLPHLEGMPLKKTTAPRVPQGFPASGAVCNIVADYFIDKKILACLASWDSKLKLPEEHAFRYSRYADDLAIMCGWKIPKKYMHQIRKDIQTIVNDANLQINLKKTRLHYGYTGKKILGMSFSRKQNIPSKQYRLLRAVLHNHGRTHDAHITWGAKSSNNFAAILKRKLDWFYQLNPEKTQKLIDRYPHAIRKLRPNL